jgi:NADH-quinone oxidoreductase subunit M
VVKAVLQYWLSGLAMSLAGFLLLSLGLMQSGLAFSFDWLTLKHHNLAIPNETLIFILLFFGFAIRMPLFPFHAWLPLLAEHGTAASVAIFITGLKLGIYALIRFILPLVPGAAEQWADFVVWLGLIGIFYGALLALMQINMRRLLAFAVISHTSMLAIGVFSFNDFALEGSILLSVAYGLATAGMLFSIGLIYERTRTSFLPRLGGLFESNATVGLLFLISALSTMVMPGTPGFDAAHLLIEGAIEEHGWWVAIAISLGNVLAAAFLLWAFQRLFIAHSKRYMQPYSSIHHPVVQERIIALAICGLLMATGFYTTPWLKFIDQEASEIHQHYPMHHNQVQDGSADE